MKLLSNPRAARNAQQQRILDRAGESGDVLALVALARDGDPDAFAQIYLRYFDRVYAYMRVALNDSHEAEDAAQQVFMNVMRAFDGYQQGEAPFSAWLFTIARNHAIQLLRKNGRVAVEEPSHIARRCEPKDDGEQELRALRFTSDEDLMLLLDCLPEAQRRAIVLRHVLDFTGPEIAELMGKSQQAVRQLQRRGLAFLHQRLTALGRVPSRGRLAMSRFHFRRGRLRPAHSVTLLR